MKTPAKLLALFSAFAALASLASANTVTFGSDNSNYRTGNGGEFTLIVNGGDPDHLLTGYPIGANGTDVTGGTSFETFCIQYGEHISLGTTYTYAISSAAKGPTGTDEISIGTSWLYGQFAQGILGGYTYTAGAARATSASILQQAIWYLEDEITLTTAQVNANVFLTGVNGAITHFGTFAAAHADAGPTSAVVVLNLSPVGSSDFSAQDQLAWPHPLPDSASTITLLGLALLGIAAFRRKNVN